MALTKIDLDRAFKTFHKKLIVELSQFLEEKLAPIPRLEKDVSGLKGSVSGLKGSVSGLKKDVSIIKNDVREVKHSLEQTNRRIDKVLERGDRQDKQMKDHHQRITQLEHSSIPAVS